MSPGRFGGGLSDDARKELEVLAKGALKLARWAEQPDEKQAFEVLAAGAIRLAR
jgi:hypothetical protein